jgi:acyl-CoA thioesterase I
MNKFQTLIEQVFLAEKNVLNCLSLFFSLFFFLNCYNSGSQSISQYSILGVLMDSKIVVNIIGDSLSYRSGAFGLASKLGGGYSVYNYSIEGRNTLDWLSDISTPFQTSPQILIIELGTNDAMTLSTTDYQKHTHSLLEEIKKRANPTILLTAIPRTEMESIQTIIHKNNLFLKSLSDEYKVVDIEGIFEKEKVNIPLYPLSDPIHPNPVGYEIMGEAYRNAIFTLH